MYTKLLKSLKHNKLFKNIKEEDLNLPFGIDNLIFKLAGEVVYKEGDPAETIFLIIDGEVKIVKERLLGTIKKIIKTSYDFFGEEDFLENMPRTSTAKLNKDCSFFVLNRTEFELLSKNYEKLKENVYLYSKEDESVPNTLENERVESGIRDAGFVKESDLDFILNENGGNNELDSAANSNREHDLTEEQMNLIWQEVYSINNKVESNDILKAILDSAKRLTHSEEGIFYLMHKDRNEIRSKVFAGDNGNEIRLKIGEGIAGTAALKKEIININDVQNDAGYNQYYDGISGVQIRNLLCSPVLEDNGDVKALFYLVNCRYGDYNKIDEKLLLEYTPFAIQAMEKAESLDNIIAGERKTLLSKMSNFLIQEIKKPILVSRRYSEHMKTKNPSVEIDRALDMQLEHLNYINDLIQSASDYADRKSSLQLETCKLNQVLQEILSKLESGITIRNCQLETKLDRDTNIQLDKKGFYIACFHLVRNACDAMQDNGKITVTTKLSFSEVAISFKDSGPGISPEIRDKVFDPFVTFNRKEGTGLGLSIVQNIIENHGGRVNIEGSYGEGAEFVITLPTI
jgi:signal transduction histidine kinase